MKNTAKLISVVALSCFMAGTVWAETDLNKGLVAYYPFNGNAHDASGNGHHGTVHGATLVPDRLGNPRSAYLFNGISNYIQVATSNRLNFGSSVDFTMAAWIKVKASQLSYPTIIGKRNPPGTANNGYVFFLSEGRLMVQLNDGSPQNYNSNSSELRDNKWHHVAVSGDRDGFLTFYVDGIQVGQVNISDIKNIDSRSNLFIGWEPANSAHTYFNGVIDEVRIYNRVLSKAEIEQLGKVEETKSHKSLSKSLCKLKVVAQTQERQLEPHDEIIYQIILAQENSCCEARNVVAKLAFVKKDPKISLKPQTLRFGNVDSSKPVEREVKIITRQATPGKVPMTIDFDFKCFSALDDNFHQDFELVVVED